MNKFQQAKVEAKVSEIMGHKVTLVKPTVVAMHQGKQSVDMQLLELENKHKQLITNAGPSMKERRENKNIFTRMGKKLSIFGDKSADLMDYICEDLPEKIKESKPVEATLDYFFPERVEEVVEIIGHYDHEKHDVVEEGNVTYLSRDFKELK